jgi:hypothetical protein
VWQPYIALSKLHIFSINSFQWMSLSLLVLYTFLIISSILPSPLYSRGHGNTSRQSNRIGMDISALRGRLVDEASTLSNGVIYPPLLLALFMPYRDLIALLREV